MIKRLLLAGVAIVAAGLAGCGDSRSHAQAVYVLVDTSGTYAQEAAKAQRIINYLLGTLQPCDSLAVARVESRSFTEKSFVPSAKGCTDPCAFHWRRASSRSSAAPLAVW